eukprot:TRINITY_DN6495_c1_g1_i1.p1 TRINITY_DN6495_c1_g1~~TRINITY_DN6495_c1_g1_i1.p1  ORF type:complete len:133 (-),score=26.83 TRINITY_DN6495_c1_g1_i1:74-472(-)
MEYLSEVFHILSVAILCIFEFEILLLFFALGRKFFSKFMYVLDLIVVTISLVIDILLSEVLSSLLILFRLWRLLRIVHGVYASIEESTKDKERERRVHVDLLTGQHRTLKEEVRELKDKIREEKAKRKPHPT